MHRMVLSHHSHTARGSEELATSFKRRSCTDSSTGLLIFIRIALGFFEAGAAPCRWATARRRQRRGTYQLAVQWFPKVSSGHLLAAAVAGQCAGASVANAFGGVAEQVPSC